MLTFLFHFIYCPFQKGRRGARVHLGLPPPAPRRPILLLLLLLRVRPGVLQPEPGVQDRAPGHHAEAGQGREARPERMAPQGKGEGRGTVEVRFAIILKCIIKFPNLCYILFFKMFIVFVISGYFPTRIFPPARCRPRSPPPRTRRRRKRIPSTLAQFPYGSFKYSGEILAARFKKCF